MKYIIAILLYNDLMLSKDVLFNVKYKFLVLRYCHSSYDKGRK